MHKLCGWNWPGIFVENFRKLKLFSKCPGLSISLCLRNIKCKFSALVKIGIRMVLIWYFHLKSIHLKRCYRSKVIKVDSPLATVSSIYCIFIKNKFMSTWETWFFSSKPFSGTIVQWWTISWSAFLVQWLNLMNRKLQNWGVILNCVVIDGLHCDNFLNWNF